MIKILFLMMPLLVIASCRCEAVEEHLYQSDEFTIYKDRIVQGDNIAEAVSSTHLKSNYKSPASTTFSRLIQFKFSINEIDNELPYGVNHWLIIGEEHASPIICFGEEPQPLPSKPETFLPTNYAYTFKLDVSQILKQFSEKGYYESSNGTRIAEGDFKGFYIAGDAEPLSWDFANLGNKGMKLSATDDPNIYSVTVKFHPENRAGDREKEWKLTEDISTKPQYVSEQPLVDTLFNLSLEEAKKNIEPDNTLRTGAKWSGVWTRDVSYSILLAFAYLEPEVGKISLRKKVKRGRIIQDTGSGGAWPVSSDRTTWALAAWEIYKVTGDKEWLDEVYPIIKNTLEDDYKTIYNSDTGLFRGESSFLDWREQTYPKWMDNKDIYASQNLGTNVVHFQAHRILVEMAKLKGEPYDIFEERATRIKKGINDYLWMKDKRYYAQYLYGRNDFYKSQRFEALGEALAILFGVADKKQATSIIGKSPLTPYGATCIYPQIPSIPPYHNNGIWPFVQSYWNLAAAKTGNETVLNHGLACVYRAAGLFLTNYENMVAETGDFSGTEINSHRMLWSMAGNLSMVHRVFMGIDYQLDGLYFNPVIPKSYGGKKHLSNFKYRNTTLNITVNGYGNKTSSVMIDGEIAKDAFIPKDWSGEHNILIELDNNEFPSHDINLVENQFTLPTVLAFKEGNLLKWQPIKEIQKYKVYKNGKLLTETTETQLIITTDDYASYSVSAIDKNNNEGFLSEPIVFAENIKKVEIETFAPISKLPYTNYSGAGFVEISTDKNRGIEMTVDVETNSNYIIDFHYSNGSGSWNTNNKCAIRSLSVNDNYEGVLVFPQRGKDKWSEWGFSNSLEVTLKAGSNKIKIHFEDWNNNMDVEVNTAMLDYFRIIKK